MEFKLMFSLICFCISGIFSLQRNMQFFQQNSYYPSRYVKWLKTSFSIKNVFNILFFTLCLSLFSAGAFKFLPFIAGGECIFHIIKCFYDRKKSIKKLVYTARIKRLLITSILFVVLVFVLSCYVTSAINVLSIVIIVITHFTSLIMFIAYYINQPMEKAFNSYYINDAKNKLKRNKNLICIGVTGSYGKTSVKFMLDRFLSEKYNTLSTPESFNTPMGIVRTVRESLTPATEIFIAEMGAKNIGDIKELCDICHPTIGIITAVGEQHLETFKTVQNVANTKFELADECLKTEKGKIYVNGDSNFALEKAKSYSEQEKIIYYGSNGATATATDLVCGNHGTSFNLNYKDKTISLYCKLLGNHNITNLLGAATLALDLGVDERQIRYAAATLKAPAHRLEMKPFLNGSLLIDDAYNSNPVGCIEAARVLGSFEVNKKIIVTPGLVELGEKEYEYNYNFGLACAENADIVILVGQKRSVPMKDAIDKTDFNKENLYIVNSFADAMNVLKNITDKDTAVLFENDLPDNYAG